jgi:hypothetical protein
MSDLFKRSKAEASSKALITRVTESEYQIVKDIAGDAKGAVSELLREGIALAIEARRKNKAKR